MLANIGQIGLIWSATVTSLSESVAESTKINATGERTGLDQQQPSGET